MERRQIRELIGRFLHNDVPGELQTQFRRWMLQPGDDDEKEAALREEWTAVVESPAAADRSEELQRLRHTIRMREAQQRRSRIFRRIRYAAAAAAVLLFAVGEYYYVRSASAVPTEIRLLTARGSKGEFQLPDGTKVWLNASSRLTYPETFDRRERRVTLEGEAYFEVARNTSHPFVVDMNRMEIEVLGTTFDARYERASGIAETTLNSGSICVRTSRSQQSVRLRPDERLVFNETTGSMIIEQVNASNYNSWIQPNLTFFDMTLEDIITNLERWFNVPIGTDASVDRTIRLSFHVRHESLEETLQVISLITGLQYTLDGESASFHTARTTRSR